MPRARAAEAIAAAGEVADEDKVKKLSHGVLAFIWILLSVIGVVASVNSQWELVGVCGFGLAIVRLIGDITD